MSRKQFALIILACAVISAGSAWGQTGGTEKSFNLLHSKPDTLTAEEKAEQAEAKISRLEAGRLETSLSLGFLGLETTLLAHPQIIYKFTNEETFWGDVELQGQSAFNPIVRMNYNLTHWFALESLFGFSVSDYEAQITNRHVRANEENASIIDDPPLGEFDAERRSVITLETGFNALLYPLNIGGNGIGRWHPFLLGGIDRIWYDLNSSYTDQTSASWNYLTGIGVRFIADDLISVRLDMVYSTTEVQFMPAEDFDVLEEGTLRIPVYEYPEIGPETPVQEFAPQTINVLRWGIGFAANF